MTTAQDLSKRLIAYARARNILLSQDVLIAVRDASEDSILTRWLTQDPDGPQLRNQEAITGIMAGIDETPTARDESLHQDLKSLRTSTSTINKQTQALKSQLADLDAIDSARSAVPQSIKDASLQTQRVRIINNGLATELHTDLESKRARLERDIRILPTIISERLKADDRDLAELSQASTRLESDMKLAEIKGRAGKLARTLQFRRVAALKDKLDTIYLTASVDATPVGLEGNPLPHEAEVKDDIHQLYTEIEDVMTMLVGTEHMNKLQELFETIERREDDRVQDVLHRANNSITDMQQNLTALISKSQASQAQMFAVSELAAQIEVSHQGAHPPIRVQKASILPASRPRTDVSMKIGKGVEDIQLILDKAVKERSQAVKLLAPGMNAEDTAKLDELEQRIAKAKGALEHAMSVAP